MSRIRGGTGAAQSRRRRCRLLVAALVAGSVLTACSASVDPARTDSATASASPSATSSVPDPPTSSTTDPSPVSSMALSQPSGDSSTTLQPRPGQLSRQGMWWGVDSVEPMSAASLANVHGWYLGHPTPLVWGRYLTGGFRLRPGELAFARAHDIAVYLIVPDADCSICGGGGSDLCGNDHSAEQAQADAAEAVRAAQHYRLPPRVVLYKDIEQIGSCYGELTGRYLVAWFRYVRAHSAFRAGFYGNTTHQSWDFPRAYCDAVRIDPRLPHEVQLAQNEPEPQLGAPRGTVGPRNAPQFRPFVPHCVSADVVRIWQYGEPSDNANVTDIDLVRPGTHGLLAPDGTAT